MPFKQVFEFLKKFEGLKTHNQVLEKEILEWCLEEIKLTPGEVSVTVRHPNIIISTKNMAAKTAVFTGQNSLFNKLRIKFGKTFPDRLIFK